MKRLFFLLLAAAAFTGMQAQGWPSRYDGVMLQAFYWDSFDDTNWAVLQSKADELSGTFDLVWLPQSGNCGGTSMGYDDLYWFNDYNSSFGNEQQLRSLISTFKEKNIKTIADVVVNHRKSNSGWFGFPTETYKGQTYSMGPADVCANDDNGKAKTEADRLGVSLGANDTGEGWDGMRDLDHTSDNVQRCVKAYLDFLKNDLGYAGFRYDMVKGYAARFTGLYNASAQPEFSVGECWDGTTTIRNWIEGTKTDDQIQSAAFDFQFRYTVRNAMNNGAWNRLAEQNDGNWPLVSSSQDGGKYRRYAVTFVENHDTERRQNAEQDPLKKDTLAANAYLLAMPGTPCVFLKHWQAYPAEIKAMVAARKAAGIHNESNCQTTAKLQWVYACSVDDKLQVVVGSTNRYVPEAKDWTRVLSGYHYAYYLSTAMQTAYISLPSGTYEGEQTATLSAVTNAEGARVVYTTDGSTPTAQSTAVESGHSLHIPFGTTILKAGLLIGGQVSGVVSSTLVVKEKEEEKPVEIPSFCTVADGEVCAFFEAPVTWGNTIYCWAWTDQPADNFTYATKGWPGVACTLLGTASNGNKVWKWTWDGTKQNNTSATQPAKIIFNNNGAPQTADLRFENGGYYTKDGLVGNATAAISQPSADAARATAIYTLDGRQVTNPQHGRLYIMNQKKVLFR